MPVYKFDWSVFVTDELASQIGGAAQLEAGEAADELRPLVAKILSAVGGLPITRHPYTASERTRIARELLHEGVKKVIRRINPRKTEMSSYLTKTTSVQELESVAYRVERAPVNTAGPEVLDRLPGIGPAVARRIIEERTANGPFTSLTDLHERVDGIGEENVKRLAGALLIDDPAEAAMQGPAVSGDFEQDFALLVACQKGGTNAERLVAALDLVATICSGDPHPFTKNGLVRQFRAPAIEAGGEAEWVGVLFGSEYFSRLPEFLLAATSRIDVCMFHIAYPDEAHPTSRLLAALKTATDRQVQVRVLMDQDRAGDPYLSSVINGAAKAFFDRHDIPCKYDRAERLMHSKYVLIDDDLAIIGSHNWSAGSYFQFDDLSLAVRSAPLVNQLRLRFTRLWDGD